MFSVRIVTTDHYQSSPLPTLDVRYADQRGAEVKKVPVIRIFGSTPAGQKTCVHVHGVFPYLYVPYDGTAPVDRYLRQFASSLDKAISVAQGQRQATIQHVYKVVLVTGISMYGYHDKEQQFLKIYMYNPSMVRKAADLLLGGAVLNKAFQPHESHIPYMLQFFIDYNLYGMNMINVGAVKFRRRHADDMMESALMGSQGSSEGYGSDPRSPTSFTALLNRSGTTTPSRKLWQAENIPSEMYLDGDVSRDSTCELEVDVVAADILNRHEVGMSAGANPGLAALWEDERQRRRDKGENTDITPPASQERSNVETSESEDILRERLLQILHDLQPYMDSQSDSDVSQEDEDMVTTQASDIDLHESQDLSDSQGTVMLEEEEEAAAIVNIESIHRIVSASQSFCDLKPAALSSQDKSLVDILEALENDASPQASQQACVEAAVLEDHDSLLSQCSQPRDTSVEKQQQKEALEMSQQVWDTDQLQREQDDKANEYDLSGMDDTWIDSQLEPADTGQQSDSDADSDIIPQYDGAIDEEPRGGMNQAITKRLGMRGPAFAMAAGGPTNYPGYAPPYNVHGNVQQHYSPPYNNYPGHPGQQPHPGSQVTQYSPPTSAVSPGWNQSQNPAWRMHHPTQAVPQGPTAGMQQSPPIVNQYGQQLNQNFGVPPYSEHENHAHYRGGQPYPGPNPGPNMGIGRYPNSGAQRPAGFQNNRLARPYGSRMLHHAPNQLSNPMEYNAPKLGGFGQQNAVSQAMGNMAGTQSFSSQTNPLQNTAVHKERFPSTFNCSASFKDSRNSALPRQGTHMDNMSMHSDMLNSCDSMMSASMTERPTGMNTSSHLLKQLNSTVGQSRRNSALYETLSLKSSMRTQPDMASPSSMSSAKASPSPGHSQTGSYVVKRPGSREFNPVSMSGPSEGTSSDLGIFSSIASHNIQSSALPSHQPTEDLFSQSKPQSSHFPLENHSVPTLYHIPKPNLTPAQLQSASQFAHTDAQNCNTQDDLINQFTKPDDGCPLPDLSSQKTMFSANRTGPQQEKPSQDKKIQMAKSTEQFMGPVSRYYAQKRLLYEQISPPATPGIDGDPSKVGKQSLASPVGQQMSPLQKLLLESSSPALSESEQHNVNRGSPSVASSPSSGHMKSQKLSPISSGNDSRNTPHSSGHIKTSTDNLTNKQLYNLLSSNKPPSDEANFTRNSSQEDIFSDSLLTPSTKGSVSNVSALSSDNNQLDTTGDSLSLFSDSFDAQLSRTPHQTSADNSLTRSQERDNLNKSDNVASLSCLENFVGSVKKDTDYGVNFNKSNSLERRLSGATEGSFLSQLSSSDLDDLDDFNQHLSLQQQHLSQQQIQQQYDSYNYSNWPEFPSPAVKAKPRSPRSPSAGGGPRKRGRPPLKKSASVPGVPVAVPEKRKRGRPRKGTSPQRFSSPLSIQTASAQHFQQFGSSEPSTPLSTYQSDQQQFPSGQQQNIQTAAQTAKPFGYSQPRGQNRQQQSVGNVPPGQNSEQYGLNPMNCLQNSQALGQNNQQNYQGNQEPVLGSRPCQQSSQSFDTSSQCLNQNRQQQMQSEFCFNLDNQSQIEGSPQYCLGNQMIGQSSQQQCDDSLGMCSQPGQSRPNMGESHSFDTVTQLTTRRQSGENQHFGITGLVGQNSQMMMEDHSSLESTLDLLQDSDLQMSKLQALPSDPMQSFNSSMPNITFNNCDNQETANAFQSNHQSSDVHLQEGQQRQHQIHQPVQFQQNQSFLSSQSNDHCQLSHLSQSMQMNDTFNDKIDSNTQNSMSTIDMSQLLQTTDNSTSNKVFSTLESHSTGSVGNSATEQGFRLNTLQSMTHQSTLVQNKGRSVLSSNPSVAKLMKYRQQPLPKPSPSAAYNFKFQVPTPLCRQLNGKSNVPGIIPVSFEKETVRMHPKDARKYSLLKVGRETVKLRRLSAEKISRIQEDFKAGLETMPIPPALRSVEVAAIPPQSSIILDLLLCDSPEETVIDSSVVDSYAKTNVHPAGTANAPLSAAENAPFHAFKHAPFLAIKKAPFRATENALLRGTDSAPLSGTQSSPLSRTENASLSRTENAPLSRTEIPSVSGTENASLSGTQSAPLSGTQTAPLSGTENASLSGTQTAPLSGTQSAPLSGTQTASLSRTEIASVSGNENALLSGTENAPLSEIDNAPLSEKKPGEEKDLNQIRSDISNNNVMKQMGDVDGLNVIKNPQKQTDVKEKKPKGMFRSKKISNIPHLKKYRAGFSYFGKGSVGRGGGTKVRQNHPVLGPDYEDDGDVILKDVSLNEASNGVLTPIKSRTPVAGRSPAHSVGNLSEIESQEKDYLDSKLKSLEYELDMKNSNNQQMFQDDFFERKVKSPSTEEDSEDEDVEDEDISPINKVSCDKIDKSDSDRVKSVDALKEFKTEITSDGKDGVDDHSGNSNLIKDKGESCCSLEKTEAKMEAMIDHMEGDYSCDSDIYKLKHVEVGASPETVLKHAQLEADESDTDMYGNDNSKEIRKPLVKKENATGKENSIDSGEVLADRCTSPSVLDQVRGSRENADDQKNSVKVKLTGVSEETSIGNGLEIPPDHKIVRDEISTNNYKCNSWHNKCTTKQKSALIDLKDKDYNVVKEESMSEDSHALPNDCQNKEILQRSDETHEQNTCIVTCSHGGEDLEKENIEDANYNYQNNGKILGKFKRQFENENTLQGSNNRIEEKIELDDIPPILTKRIRDSRSRSSSSESRSVNSRSGSRRSSLANSVENAQRCSQVLPRKQTDYKNDEPKLYPKRKKKDSNSSSSTSESIKSSHSSSIDDCRIKNMKKRGERSKKRKYYCADSDSDGEPGVDYIVVGKFKGCKAMKVVVSKLDIVDTRIVNVKEVIKDSKQNETKLGTGKVSSEQKDKLTFDKCINKTATPAEFSAEFEKFLMRQSHSDCQKDDFDQSLDMPEDDCSTEIRNTDIQKEQTEFEKFLIRRAHSDYQNDDFDQSLDMPEDDCSSEVRNTDMQKEHTDFKDETIESKGGAIDCTDSETNDLVESKMEEETVKQEKVTTPLVAENSSEPDCEQSLCETSGNIVDNLKTEQKSDTDDRISEDAGKQMESLGVKDFSSSSEDDSDEKQTSNTKNHVTNSRNKKVHKKKKKSFDRIGGGAFCGKTRRKRKRPKAQNSKLMFSLSVLHDATLEKLTVPQCLNEVDLPSSEHSPVIGLPSSDSLWKAPMSQPVPEFPVYSDRAVDHDSVFVDSMYKLAYYSPPLSENGNSSPPQPVSPEELRKRDEVEDSVGERMPLYKEHKVTLMDITKTFIKSGQPMLGEQFYETPASSVETVKSKENSPKSSRYENNDLDAMNIQCGNATKEEAKEPTVKTAVAKVATLTLKDIKSYCEEENAISNKQPAHSHEWTSPPDLGPPFFQKTVPVEDIVEDTSAPPELTLSRVSESSDSSIPEKLCLLEDETKHVDEAISDKAVSSKPPFLTPCRSPRVSLSPRNSFSPQIPAGMEPKQSNKTAFSWPVLSDVKVRPGRSPGACSVGSAGSINVIHSEQFSDISDESDCEKSFEDNPSKFPSHNPSKFPSHSEESMNISKSQSKFPLSVKERKLREINDFEERLKISDENKNNIFDILSPTLALSRSSEQPQKEVAENVFEYERTADETYIAQEKSALDLSFKDKSQNKGSPALDKCRLDSRTDNSKSYVKQAEQNSHWDFSLDKKLNRNHQNHHLSFQGDFELSADVNMDYLHQQNCGPPNTFDRRRPSYDAHFDPQVGSDGMFREQTKVDLSMPRGAVNSYPQNRQYVGSFSMPHGSFSQFADNINPVVPHPQLGRSLSESSKLDYCIDRNSKMISSFAHEINSMRDTPRSNGRNSFEMYPDEVPFNTFGGGCGSRRGNVRKSSAQRGRSGFQSSGYSDGRNTGIDSGRNDDSHLDERDRDDEMKDYIRGGKLGCHVITPLTPPPSWEFVQHTSSQYGLPSVPASHAFYGNPRDGLEKPREGGGQVLKVTSTRVKDLEEYGTTAQLTGLGNWRANFCINDSLLSTQSETETISDKLVTEPAYKYVITGDQSVIISPCQLPPARQSVEQWLKGRQIYKQLKSEVSTGKQKKCMKDKTEGGSSEARVEYEKDTGRPKRKREVVKTRHEVDREQPSTSGISRHTVKLEDSSQSTLVENELHSKLNDDSNTGQDYTSILKSPAGRDTETEDQMLLSPAGPSSGEGDQTLLSPAGPSSGEGDQISHSTPMLRRGSTDLFAPDCTPIPGEKRHQSEDSHLEQSFVSAKRKKLIRRLSTGTDTALRQAILTTQMKQQFCTPAQQRGAVSQIDGPTPKNSFGFRVSQQNFQDAKALHEYQHLTILSVEIHVETRGDLKPDPEHDPIQAIFYSLFNDVPEEQGTRQQTGIFMVDLTANQEQRKQPPGKQTPGKQTPKGKGKKMRSPEPGTSKDIEKPWQEAGESLLQKSGVHGYTVVCEKNEQDLINSFTDFILRCDPDILVGYEIQMLSWGYLLQRASCLNINLAPAISRVPSSKQSSHHSAEKDEYGADHNSEIHIAGRIVLNLWRLLRHEVTLNVYTFENVAFHVLHRRIALFSHRSLTAWYKHRTHLHRWKVVQHYMARTKGNLELMEQLDLVGRTSEFARVFGIEFYHVLSRGSQYRVESMMLRVAKPMNCIPVSPSIHQRARMKAPECIALTLEPKSRFYTDPVLVLDFQSLYPSIMIAYNYCFSTCLGRLEWLQNAHDGAIDFGCTSLNIPPAVLKKLQNDVSISPNGVVFCKSSVKRGVLPVMVEEILKTRLMVKKAMAGYKSDKTLTRLLHARQMGLKLIANVTYGYTAANFSGRMPCIEIGDSIVRKARETLERSIKLVEETPRWGAEVLYGDTDSMFLRLKGRSKDEAFVIGQEIADAVTAMFPKPIKLRFEKVYLPCLLQSKKRYVGFMYETRDQKEPKFDAKGIETVRRDTCTAVSKMLERSIKILFSSRDVSQVKSYIQQQCQKVMEGNVSLQDFVFAKEYRGMSSYRPGACVPALEISKKLVRADRRAEPRVGERVPYVIVYGSPGLPLIQLVRQPLEVLKDTSLRLNATYYISKQILPPLHRFLSLLGVDVFTWYQEMPHSTGKVVSAQIFPQAKKGTISQYFSTSNCPVCDRQTKLPVCRECMQDPQTVCTSLNNRITKWDRAHKQIQQICGSCVGCPDVPTIQSCVSLDCPVLYRMSRANIESGAADGYREILAKIFK